MHETNVSRRALLRGLASVGSVIALGGCAGLGATGAHYDASSFAGDPTLLVTTTRKRVNGGRAKPWFGPERASAMTVARAKLVPPDDGRLSLSAVGLGNWRLDGVEPVSGDVSELLAQAGGGGDVLIYVHGFKQTFETAALDAAYLSDAIKFRGRTMAFSWPSKAGLFDYAYDRDSAMWSRDDFERVLSSIVSAPGGGRVHIVAHSMGTMLTLESLRQLYARYGDSVAGRIGAVVFAAPDIDMDVFSSAIKPHRSARRQDHRDCRDERSRVGAVGTNRWRDDTGRRRREGRHRAARGARDRCVRRRLGRHQPRFVPVECRGAAGDTPLD